MPCEPSWEGFATVLALISCKSIVVLLRPAAVQPAIERIQAALQSWRSASPPILEGSGVSAVARLAAHARAKVGAWPICLRAARRGKSLSRPQIGHCALRQQTPSRAAGSTSGSLRSSNQVVGTMNALVVARPSSACECTPSPRNAPRRIGRLADLLPSSSARRYRGDRAHNSRQHHQDRARAHKATRRRWQLPLRTDCRRARGCCMRPACVPRQR